MGNTVQKTFQGRRDKKRKNTRIRDFSIYLLFILLITGVLTGFSEKNPQLAVFLTVLITVYLLLEKFLNLYETREFEILSSVIVLAGTVVNVSGEDYLHLIYIIISVFTGINLSLRMNLYVLCLIILMEGRHLFREISMLSLGDEIIFILSVLFVNFLAIFFTDELKKKLKETESTLKRLIEKSEIYDLLSLEDEDILSHNLYHARLHDEEIESMVETIKRTIYADGIHILLNRDNRFILRYSTDNALVIFSEGLIYDVYKEGTSKIVRVDSSKLLLGYATDYEVNSILIVPLKEGSTVTGVLLADSMRHGAFTENELFILENYSKMLSIVLSRYRLIVEKDRSEKIVKILLSETRRLSSTLKFDEILTNIIKTCEQIAPSSYVTILSHNKNRFVILKQSYGDGRGKFPKINTGFNYSKNPFYTQVFSDRRPFYISRIMEKDREYLPVYSEDVSSLLALPMWYEDSLLGIIILSSQRENAFNQEQMLTLELFANQSAISLMNSKLYSEIETLAISDGLTGLYNHRKFQEELEREVKRHKRTGFPLCLALIDIDFFKKVNDTYGHPAGDAVLKGVAGIIKNTIRSTDIPARYGGEEFSIIMIESNLKNAKIVAERLRRKVEDSSFRYENNVINVTLSIGISSMSRDIEKGRLIDMADQALYHAKKSGRNRTVLWEEIGKI